VRVSVVDDPNDLDLLDANAGSPQEVTVGDTVTLDGSRSIGPDGFSYSWEQTNPAGSEEVKNLAEAFGSISCNGTCYRVNFNADTVVDGLDVAILANNMGPANLTSTDQAMTQFVAGIAAYIQAHHQRWGKFHIRDQHCRGAPSECGRGIDGALGGSDLFGSLGFEAHGPGPFDEKLNMNGFLFLLKKLLDRINRICRIFLFS
jgi:hypothetical protein